MQCAFASWLECVNGIPVGTAAHCANECADDWNRTEMPRATITVNTDPTEKDAIDAAAAAAGMSTSAYTLAAVRAKMTRDAAVRYREILATNAEFAAESARARQFALASAANIRARLVAGHDGTPA
jgi:uncharacterized protein (DUF1778 family)